MKIVFLDIDGVLNSHYWWRRRGTVEQSREFRFETEIDPLAVARVQRLCEQTGAVIVISSMWRKLYSLVELREKFASRGLTIPIIGMTPDHSYPSSRGIILARERGHEIQAFLDEVTEVRGPVESFVILDDDSDMVHLMPRLVKTTYDFGLTDAHVEQAVVLLGELTP